MRFAVILLLAAGCKKPAPPTEVPQPIEITRPAPAPAPQPDPQATLDAIEAALLGSDFAVRFDVQSEGKIDARLVGELRRSGDRVALLASGTFAGLDVELALATEGDRLVGSGAGGRLEVARPEALVDALVVGLVRMGVLHNLARLVSARPPDHADGGVREWVRAAELEAGDVFAHAGAPRPEGEALSFTLVVDERPSGDATLWWDPQSRLPLARHLTVHFEDGDMRVRETYDFNP